MRGILRSIGVGLAILMTFLLTFPAIAWQGTPEPITEAPVGVLAEVEVDRLPSTYVDTRATPAVELPPAAEVWFLRLTLDPEGLLPMGMQIGPTVLVVESGALTLEADAPVAVTGSGGEPVAAGGDTVSVEAGQSVSVREDTTLTLRNAGDQPVSVLALLVFSPYRESIAMEAAQGEPMAEPRGLVRQQPLGVASAVFPDGPGVITIERVALAAGEMEITDVPAGAVVGGVEQGGTTVSVERGECLLWPAMMNQPTEGEERATPEQVQAPRRERLLPGGSAEMAQHDAFGCQDVAATWTASDVGATIIRATVAPAGGTVATPAAAASPIATDTRPMGMLAEADVPALPSPDAEVWLVRYSLAPGGALPSVPAIGPMLALVESGELALTSDQPIELTGASAAGETGDTVLGAGAAVSVPDGATIAARNDGDEPVVFLIVEAFSPEREVAAMEADSGEEPQGLTVMGVAVTHASFPDGPGRMRIGRFAVSPDTAVPYQSLDTALVVLVERGGGTLAVSDGACGVFPPMGTTPEGDVMVVGPDAPEGRASAELDVGGGFGCGGADATWETGPDGMTILFAEVVPSEG